MQRMDNSPYAFIKDHSAKDLQRLKKFRHRTFNDDDLYYFIDFFHQHYSKHNSLEFAFFPIPDLDTAHALTHFKKYFFSFEHLKRTEKHISSPLQKSTCKRLNMFLRWMVRTDNKGVDFGLWKNIRMDQLLCPCDLHVERVARKLKLIKRKQTDWQTVLELSSNLRKLDPIDPIKYDFALFGLGIEEGWSK